MTKLQRILRSVNVEIKKLHATLTDELQDRLDGALPSDARRIIADIYNRNGVKNTYRELSIESGAEAANIPVPVFREYYKNAVAVDKERLSDKVNNLARVDEIAERVRQAMLVEGKWSKMANDLVKTGITKAELPDYMDNLLLAARNAANLTDDEDAYRKYQKQLSRVGDRVDKLTDTDTSELAQAYRDIKALSLDASEEVVDAAVERAVMFKARANAQRLITSETARAYGNSQIYRIQQDEDAVGVRWELSEQHEHYCICDFFAESDMFGMGDGVYPKDEVPDYPAHPWCACELTPVYEGEAGEYDDKAGEREFEDLDPEDRQALVGKEGSWDDVEWEDHQVPEYMQRIVE